MAEENGSPEEQVARARKFANSNSCSIRSILGKPPLSHTEPRNSLNLSLAEAVLIILYELQQARKYYKNTLSNLTAIMPLYPEQHRANIKSKIEAAQG